MDIKVEKSGTSFTAYSDEVPGCFSIGNTVEEARANYDEALAGHRKVESELGKGPLKKLPAVASR